MPPPSRLNIAIPVASPNGKYYGRYPQGNAPVGGNSLVAGASESAAASGSLITGIKLSGAPTVATAVTGALTTGGSWQLPAGHYVVSALPLTIIAPYAGLSGTNRYYTQYPGLLYRVPVVAYGGAWPYQYEISGPSGMTVGQHDGDTDYGIINWTNPVAGSYSCTVTITDQVGTVVSVTWTLTVTTSGFVFVDEVNGHPYGTGAGTLSNPFKTMADWYFASTSGSAGRFDTTYQNSIIYYRAGTYLMDACYVDTNGAVEMGDKPRIHLGYPGESVTFDPHVTGGNACWYPSNVSNIFFGEITFADVANNGSSGMNQSVRLSSGATDAHFFEVTWDTPSTTVSGSNNQSFVMSEDNHPSILQRFSMTHCTFNGTVGRDLFLGYYTQYCVFEWNTLAGVNDGIGFFAKLGFNDTWTVRANTGLAANTGRSFFSADAYNNVTNTDVCFNNYASSGAGVYFGPDPGGTISTQYFFRNTWQVSEHTVDTCTVNGLTVTDDVLIYTNSSANSDGVQVINGGTLTSPSYSGTECVGLNGTFVTAATGALTGVSRTNYLGLRGHERA